VHLVSLSAWILRFLRDPARHIRSSAKAPLLRVLLRCMCFRLTRLPEWSCESAHAWFIPSSLMSFLICVNFEFDHVRSGFHRLCRILKIVPGQDQSAAKQSGWKSPPILPPINVPRYLHLDLSKHVMRNISRFRLRAHTLKVEAAAWLEDGSCVCDQCPGEDEHVQNEVHTLFAATGQQPTCSWFPFSAEQ